VKKKKQKIIDSIFVPHLLAITRTKHSSPLSARSFVFLNKASKTLLTSPFKSIQLCKTDQRVAFPSHLISKGFLLIGPISNNFLSYLYFTKQTQELPSFCQIQRYGPPYFY